MSETLPSAIVTQLEEFGRALQTLTREQADAPLATLEQAVLALVREFSPRFLAGVVTASQSSLQPAARALRWQCPTCDARTRVQSWPDRTVLTVCGKLTFERPWCHCARCGHGWSPTDAQLELAPRARLSPGCHEWVITEGADESFARAAEKLERLAGLVVSDETVRQHTEDQGQALEAADAAARTEVLRTREAAEPVDAPPGQLVVETDGVMIRYRQNEWHEVKVGLVAGYVDGALVAPSYVAAREPAEVFGGRLLTEAARRGALEILGWEGSVLRRQRAILRDVTVVGDGAPWIWNLAADQFDRRTEIVDYYHAAEHLSAAARAAFGDGPAAEAWAKGQRKELLDYGGGPVREALRPLLADTPAGWDELRKEREYFRRNADRMEYPTFRTQGLPIGSGAVESSAGHLIQARLKLAGARWSPAGAQAVMAVRCRVHSHRALAA